MRNGNYSIKSVIGDCIIRSIKCLVKGIAIYPL